MLDEALAARLIAIVPPSDDPAAVVVAVRRRDARRRQVRRTALGGSAVVLAVGGFAVALPRAAEPAKDRTSYHGLAPACGFPDPFTGFVPGTDSAVVARTRGTPPTRLVAHAGRGDFVLKNLRMEVSGPAGVVRVVTVASAPAAGQDLPIDVGDVADDGTAIPPGRYTVTIAADVTGRNSCGERAWQHVDTVAGYLVVR